MLDHATNVDLHDYCILIGELHRYSVPHACRSDFDRQSDPLNGSVFLFTGHLETSRLLSGRHIGLRG